MTTSETHTQPHQQPPAGIPAPSSGPRVRWAVMPAADIMPAEQAGALNALHVLNLAESIAGLGLLEPIIIDAQARLLAGAHRLAAVQLLLIGEPEERVRLFSEAGASGTMAALIAQRVRRLAVEGFRELYPSGRIPVLVVDTAGEEDIAAAVRMAEIAARRQWRVDIAQELRDGGFVARNRLARKLRTTVATLTVEDEDLA